MEKLNKNKTIIFFDFAPLNYGGGCELNFIKFGEWLQRKNYNVIYITPSLCSSRIFSIIPFVSKYKSNISKDDLSNKFGVRNYQTFSIFDLIFYTKNKRKIKKIFKDSDMIYSKNEIFEVFLLKFCFKADFSKLIFGFHTPIFYPSTRDIKSKLHNFIYNSNLFFNLIKNSKIRYLVLSNNDKSILESKNIINVNVIPNPLNVKKFHRINYQKKHPFNIYYIGRMTEQKGVDTLALVIKNLASMEIFKKCNFFFVGSGELEYFLKNISSEYDNCYFLGFKTDVLGYYLDADLVVVPSRWESFCYTVAEAQSCGVPVLCSDVPGPRDIIIPDKTGWAVMPDDIQGFVDGIKKAYKIWNEDFSSYQEIGRLSRVNVIKNYEEEEINLKIESFMFRENNHEE